MKQTDQLIRIYNEIFERQEQYGRIGYIEIKHSEMNRITEMFNKKITEIKELLKETEK